LLAIGSKHEREGERGGRKEEGGGEHIAQRTGMVLQCSGSNSASIGLYYK